MKTSNLAVFLAVALLAILVSVVVLVVLVAVEPASKRKIVLHLLSLAAGHISRECPPVGGEGQECYKCGKAGPMARNCDQGGGHGGGYDPLGSNCESGVSRR